MKIDWAIVDLKTVCKFQNGFAFKSKTFKNKGIPVIRIKNIQNETVDLSEIVYIDSNEHEKDFTKYEVRKGDLLIAMSGATTGKIGIHKSNEVLLLNQRVGKFEPTSQLNKKYLFYFLSTKVEESLAISAGSAQPNLSTEQIKNFKIPFPPITEQKQIVAILDKAFAAIDQAKAHTEKNIQNAQELFQSKLNEIFSQKDEGWEVKNLGEMSKIMYGYTSKIVENGNIQYVRITDIQNGTINWSSVPLVNISNEEKSKYELIKGDIVFARTGATTGKSYLMENPPKSVFASYLIRVQCDLNIIEPSFLYLFFQSGYYWELVESGISGSAQGGFNASKLSKMVIAFPKDINKQLEYVELINSIKLPIQEMEKKYQVKLSNLNDLKKSILQKAFAGELT